MIGTRNAIGTLLVLLLAGLTTGLPAPAAAALNGNHDFATPLAYQSIESLQTGNVSLLSGALDVTFAPTSEPLVFARMASGTMTGLTKVCWPAPLPDCRQSSTGALSISWTSGSSLAFKFPSPAPAAATAKHAVVLFVDPDASGSFGGFDVHFGPSLAAITVDSVISMGPIPMMPDTPIQSLNANNAAGLSSLTPGTTFTVSGAGNPERFAGAQQTVTFQGRPSVAPFGAQVLLLPFEGGSLGMGPAETDAAHEGLDRENLERGVRAMGDAWGVDTSAIPFNEISDKLGALGGVQDKLLNGALVRIPPPQEESMSAITQSLTLIRFDGLHATGSATQAATSGSGPLIVEKGRVQNAQSLVGIAYFQLPWWSYVLWLLAIGGIVTRMVMQAPKESERWDKLRWIGWIAGPLAAILFFWLWDNEVHRVFGTSLLSGGASGTGLGVIALLQFLPLGIIFFAVVTPLRIILQSAFRVLKQGSFMGLATPSAILLGFLLGATLMLSYFDLVLRSVSGT